MTTVICRKMKICPLNITCLNKFFYRIVIKSMKSFVLQENVTRKMIKISYSPQI